MNEIILYTNGNQESERLKSLFGSLSIDISHEYLLGIDFSDRQFRAEFGSEAEYPQVAIGYQHIGGLKESLHYLKDREVI